MSKISKNVPSPLFIPSHRNHKNADFTDTSTAGKLQTSDFNKKEKFIVYVRCVDFKVSQLFASRNKKSALCRLCLEFGTFFPVFPKCKEKCATLVRN